MNEAAQTILIVDDVEINALMLEEMLSDEYRVYVALNGADALKIAEELHPDLVLLDIVMPEMDGFEMFRQLRMIKAMVNVPIIFISQLDEVNAELSGLALGAVDYITKPFCPETVSLRVRNILELKRQRDMVEERNQQLNERNMELCAALSRVKLLEGIISICMYCKKIRSEDQSWEQLEKYISEHSDAMFSHSICPHCFEAQKTSFGLKK